MSDAATKKNTTSKPASLHPKTTALVTTAVKVLKERNGSSLPAIKKYIAANYKVDFVKLAPFMKKALKSLVEKKVLLQTKGTGASGSFKVNSAVKEEKKKVKKLSSQKKKSSSPKKKKPSTTATKAKSTTTTNTTTTKKPSSPKKVEESCSKEEDCCSHKITKKNKWLKNQLLKKQSEKQVLKIQPQKQSKSFYNNRLISGPKTIKMKS